MRMEPRRGHIDIAVLVDRDLPEGMPFIPSRFNEATASLLTNPQPDSHGEIPEFKLCALRLEA